MYIIEKMDFEKTKKSINNNYISIVEFLESLEITNKLAGDAPLTFQYGDLMQNWRLQVLDQNNDFSIICNKKNNKIHIECLTSHSNLSKLTKNSDCINLIDYFESEYSVKIDKVNSDVVKVPNHGTFHYFDFSEVPEIEQISSIYRDLFLEKRS